MRILRRWIIILVIPVASFFVTLELLDYWSPTAQRAEPTLGLSRAKYTTLYNLILESGDRNFRPSNRETRLNVANGNVVINSTVKSSEYILQTDYIYTQIGASYTVKIDSKIRRGAVSVGVIDGIANKWITTVPITAENQSVSFKAHSHKTGIVLFNTGDSAVDAIVSKLDLVTNGNG